MPAPRERACLDLLVVNIAVALEARAPRLEFILRVLLVENDGQRRLRFDFAPPVLVILANVHRRQSSG